MLGMLANRGNAMKKILFWVVMGLGINCGIIQKLVGRVGCVVGIYDNHQFNLAHPAYHFSLVQTLCVQLETDLDIMKLKPDLYKQWTEETDYLLDQFLRLYSSLSHLVTYKNEAHAYLKEDAEFLIASIERVINKYKSSMVLMVQDNDSSFLFLAILLKKIGQKALEILLLNHEVLIPAYMGRVFLRPFFKIPTYC